jgi:hypothetical protein
MINKQPEFQAPNCTRCGTPLVKIKDKNYWGCPRWKPDGKGCEGDIWFPANQRRDNYPNVAFSYKVESRSNPGHFYIVRTYESGDMDCPCTAGQMNRFCSHKRKAIEEVGKIVEIIRKKTETKNVT